jgi:hypothetical protein
MIIAQLCCILAKLVRQSGDFYAQAANGNTSRVVIGGPWEYEDLRGALLVLTVHETTAHFDFVFPDVGSDVLERVANCGLRNAAEKDRELIAAQIEATLFARKLGQIDLADPNSLDQLRAILNDLGVRLPSTLLRASTKAVKKGRYRRRD